VKVNEVKDDLSQIGFDIEAILQMVAGLVSAEHFFIKLIHKLFSKLSDYPDLSLFMLSGREDQVS
jgi:hypothetical protein